MAYRKQNIISKADMLARIVEPIREAMAAGKLPWLRPWIQGGGGGLPQNPLRNSDNKDYTGGVNNLLLMIASMTNGWSDPRWMGRGQVKKGGYSAKGLTNLKSTLIYIPVFGWRTVTENGEEKRIKFVTGFREGRVFNAEQIQDESFPPLPKPDDTQLDTVTGYERAHAIYDAVGVHVVHGDEGAKYNPKRDRIYMPVEGAFETIAGYHATRMHETGHATGHKSRLDRGLFGGGFGSNSYAYEELVAELFSAFACADAGIEKTELTANHAAYLQSWHRRLGEKPEMFVNAINDAWQALTWVRERVT
jgi:antirestriction protein ArdC